MSQNILYLEPVGGIAGDMFLAAALDLGVPRADLEASLRTLDLPGWRLSPTRASRHHITGTHVEVVMETPEAHPHRPLSEIAALISRSGLSSRAKERALGVFRLLGEAEARVHSVPIEQIHFHEVGAVDAIIDVCAAAVALEALGDPQVYSAPPPLGGGTTRAAHGVIPVPAPATLEILRDVPVRFEGSGELTTPTGAALLKGLAKIEAPPELIVERVGYGIGTKDWKDRANVLRATLGRVTATADSLVVLECNLDDCSPQLLGALLEELLSAGAMDAWVVPAVMKKGRPGHLLGALVPRSVEQVVTSLILRESTTLGVRRTSVERTTLERRWEPVSTPWGEVRMKIGFRKGEIFNAAPEFDDCRRLATEHRVPMKEVQAAAVAAWRQARRTP